MLNKKILAVFLCVSLGISLSACGSPGNGNTTGKAQTQDTQEKAGTDENEGQEAENGTGVIQEDTSEPATMTDEELLEALGDNVNVVADDKYEEMVNAFLEHTDDYVGQIYQLTGSFAKEGQDSYLTRDTEAGATRIPLKCLIKEPEEGSEVRITGIINYGDINGETVPVLDVAVIEELDG